MNLFIAFLLKWQRMAANDKRSPCSLNDIVLKALSPSGLTLGDNSFK